METGIVKLTPELLSLFAASTADSNFIAPFTQKVFLLDITVAGTSLSEHIDEIFTCLEIGTVLRLQRDLNNQYDENAIGVYYRGLNSDDEVLIGWVPRTMNTVISRLMDAGKNLFCQVCRLDTEDYEQWKRIDCKIFMVE